MRTQHRHLNDLFSQARGENDIVSQQEIDALLDAHERHGRQFDAASESSPKPNTIPKRGITMGMLSTVIVGGLIGVGTFFWDGDGKDRERGVVEHPASAAETGGAVAAGALIRGMPTWSLRTGTVTAAPRAAETSDRAALTTPVSTTALQLTDRVLHQRDGDDPEETVTDEATLEKEAEELGRQIGSFVTDYWYDRINSYRQFIDRSLDATDLAELNRLRVRWELAEGDGTGMFNLQMGADRALSSDGKTLSQSMTFSTDDRDEPTFISNVDFREDSSSVHISLDDGEGEAAVNAVAIELGDFDSASAITMSNIGEIDIETDVNVNVQVEADADGETRTERKIITRIRKRNLANDSAADGEISARMFRFDGLDGLDRMPIGNMLKMAISFDPSDRSAIFRETWEIADRNRSRLDDLKAQVLADVAAFNRELSTRLRAYAASSDTELAAKLSVVLEDEDGLTEPMMRVLGPLYDVLAEPMLMLYNGSDITPVLSSAITEPVAGITLEGRSALAQSYPNPASSHATIDFTLAEGSSATTLRLFDVNGNEVIRRDLGRLGSGAHRENLDLSTLAAGTYLYHLTVEGPDGSRVWSRTLEVVR